ncbi:MAG: hypothetical protein M3237_20150 [Actinomycetota bacterium]|nr:hypothetical protein [Actinomycetota bacterium]
MKFRIGLVVGAVALGLSLVNPSTATASASASGAGAAADPYPRTLKTVCDARRLKNPYRAGKKERFRMIIIENATDMPRVRLTYVKQRKMANGKFKTVRKYRGKRYYHGKPVNLPFQSTRNGKYRIVVRTNFGPKSQFRNCRDSITFRVAGGKSPQPAGNGGNGNGGNGNGGNGAGGNGAGGNGSGELPSTGARQD